jgi:hypothetical protein
LVGTSVEPLLAPHSRPTAAGIITGKQGKIAAVFRTDCPIQDGKRRESGWVGVAVWDGVAAVTFDMKEVFAAR